MKVFALLVISLVLFSVACASEKSHPDVAVDQGDVSITKRGFIQFYAMIRRETGRDPLDYWGYGCWCGYGGRGTPRDAVDRCCRSHDWCYNRIIRRRICGRNQVYHKNYFYSGLKCSSGWLTSRCGRSICKCDVKAVKCFKRNHFNHRYKNWNKRRC